MTRAKYYVLQDAGQWKIRHNGRDHPHASQSAAIRAAIDAAHQSGRQGDDAQVFVQGQDGRWRLEWSYGRDPYPPRG